MTNHQYEKYRGLRALEFLRVSTPLQEKMYGWPRQGQAVREKLVDPLDLDVVHVIRDSYTGLEFKEREALDLALAMAKKGEYDLLVMDMLERLGRKGLEREIYLMQLRQTGVRVLTTDPDDHADDESLWGESIRYLKGKASEDEVKNTRYRTMGGRRAKALGDPEKGIPPRLVGNGQRIYGYKYIIGEKGRRIGIELNYAVVYVEPDGTEWTEVKVVRFIFEQADNGVSLTKIAEILNQKGIPSPYVTKQMRAKNMRGESTWLTSTLSRVVRQSAYWGKAVMFKTRPGERVPGKRYGRREKTTEAEQVIIDVPAIISEELALRVQARVTHNQSFSARNNRDPEATLMRSLVHY